MAMSEATASGRADHLRASHAAILVVACILWAGSAVAAKVCLADAGHTAGRMGPFTLAAIRFGVAGLVLCGFQVAQGHSLRVHRADLGRFIAIGVFGIGVTYAVFYGGMRYTSATETTLLVASEPILITIMARLALGERCAPAKAWGLALGLSGVYVVVFQGWRPQMTGTVMGNAVVLLAMVFEAGASVVGKGLSARYRGLTIAGLEMVIGAGVLLPGAIRELSASGNSHLSARALGGVAYLTLVCSLLCYGAWYSLLPRLRLSTMAAFLFIQPIFGPVLGWALLGERPGAWTFAGGVLTLVGIYIVAARDARGGRLEGDRG